MPAATTRETQSDAPRLIPVMVEVVEALERAATTQTVAQWLEQQLSPLRDAAGEPRPRVDFNPMAERLAPLLREQDLPVRRPHRGVHLKEVDGERRLWLIVGAPEADSMILALRQESPPRPLTHDLTGHLLGAAGLRVTRAAIERHENNTYYATVTVRGPRGRSHEVDARVTDAICLALRASAPIVVAEPLLRRAGPGLVRPDPTSADATDRIAAAVTPTAQRALDVMRQEAADLGHHYLGTEHLLLGLLGASGAAADFLAQHGVTAEKMRHGIAAIVGRSRVLVGETFQPQPNLEPGRATPRLNALYERALQHAAARDPQRVDTVCLLLGLLGDPGSLAAGLLESAGADPVRLMDAVRTAAPVDPPEDR